MKSSGCFQRVSCSCPWSRLDAPCGRRGCAFGNWEFREEIRALLITRCGAMAGKPSGVPGNVQSRGSIPRQDGTGWKHLGMSGIESGTRLGEEHWEAEAAPAVISQSNGFGIRPGNQPGTRSLAFIPNIPLGAHSRKRFRGVCACGCGFSSR